MSDLNKRIYIYINCVIDYANQLTVNIEKEESNYENILDGH